MQPTYLPWIGYFGLISHVDCFVILDTVQFSKRSWQHRNQIKTPNGPQLLTIPVKTKGLREQKICDVKIDHEIIFLNKHIKSIEQNYRKSIFYYHFKDMINSILLKRHSNLADLNIDIINLICNFLEIKTNIVRSSKLKSIGVKDELLYFLCKEIGATHYVSPPGSFIYLENSHFFKNNNIDYSYFNYDHPEYNQLHGKFMPYMSILDLLFNEMPSALKIIKSGIRNNI